MWSVRIAFAVLFAGFVGYLFYALPVDVAIATATIPILGGTADHLAVRGRRYVIYAVVAYFLLLVVVETASAYISPNRLPRATVEVRGEPRAVAGTLIVSTGDAWYIAEKGKSYRAVTADRVLSVVVQSRERSNPRRPALRMLWEWLRDGDSEPGKRLERTDRERKRTRTAVGERKRR